MKRPKLTVAPDPGVIEIRGARQNNLKGFDLDVPLGKLNVITGPSGSGKSSLAFDTIYAEGQRRYVETFSPYTRQFLDRMDKPKVDEIRGIPPAIAIEQSNPVKSTRSTVGTITEINDYLKVLLPRVVTAQCPECARPIRPESAKSIVEEMFAHHAGETVLVTFGVPAPVATKPADFFDFLKQQGYLRAWIENAVVRLDEATKLKRLPAVVAVIQDRVTLNEENRARFTEAVETALRFGKGKIAFIVMALVESARVTQHSTLNTQLPYSTGWHCAHCDLDIAPPTPGLFSFNNPLGACPACRGFGRAIAIDLERAIPDRSLSIAGGVIKPFQTENGRECQRDLLRCAAVREVDVKCPFDELVQADRDWVMYGERKGAKGDELWQEGLWYGVKGFFDWLESKAYKMHVRVLLSRYRNYTECPDCRGGRFQPATLNFRLAGKTLPELMALPVSELIVQVALLPDSTTAMLRDAVVSRLRYLLEVGLEYLSLDRATRTLSGGEIERVNLTTCLGAALVNTLFVLDEPSIGLHPRDTGRLIRVMKNLRDKGNTLIVVEHDEAVIRAADNMIELGPGRGDAGGDLVYQGAPDEVAQAPRLPAVRRAPRPETVALRARRPPDFSQAGAPAPLSLTAEYLTGRKSIPIPASRRTARGVIRVEAAREHNLRGIDVEFPLKIFTCITGVSGSGKSTLIHDVLYRNLLREKNLPTDETPGVCGKITGAKKIDHVVMVDQSPLARTPRSTPALYLGIYDRIRELFAETPDAVGQGLTPSAFSFNSGTGRCERCGGMGFEKIEMQFLSDVFVRCPECEGRRFQPHILAIRWEGKTIDEVLGMTVDQAVVFFGTSNFQLPTSNIEVGSSGSAKSFEVESWTLDVRCSKLLPPLQTLAEVGLGYLTLGQPLNVLSGGESQRLKLVERLTNKDEENCLLIFDEPTTGLHFDDIALLVRVFDRLVEQGHTVLVIEHNLEVIKRADWVIDLGPEAGAGGGEIVAMGTPEEVAAVEESHTGRFLREVLGSALVPSAGFGVPPKRSFYDVESAESARVAETPNEVREGGTPSPARETRALPGIRIVGAREHNLKNISVDIPRDQIVVVTGLSGSGKSTLAFDILFAEGQRRFLDSMSAYARQFVEQLEKPDVDLISGLPPSVAIEQRITRGGGKSTVATVTEVYHFLRLLFAKLGTQFCPKCDLPVQKQSLAAIVKQAAALAKRGKIRVLAPLVKARKGFHGDVAKWALRQGFETMLVDGKFERADAFPKLERFREHSIDVLVSGCDASSQTVPAAPSPRGDTAAAVKRAIEIGKGTAKILDAKNKLTVLSTEMSCPGCGDSFEELDPRLFSFNSPHGWCPECHGFGETWKAYENPRLETAIEIEMDRERQHRWLDEGEAVRCAACEGTRLNPVARHVRVQGSTIGEATAQAVREAHEWVCRLRFSGNESVIAADILPEIEQRLSFMGKVGLDYLSLDRSAKTMSGGESQRIRLAAQLGSNLRGVLYVLDEPTIGLHPRDNDALLDTLEALKKKGNTLVIVEHDEETMRRADTIIDMGPRAGTHGGEIVAVGTLAQIKRTQGSETGRCLREPLAHPTRGERRALADVTRWIEVRGATRNNLKNLDVRFPVGRLSVISGISGSGKSTLMRGVLKPAVEAALRKNRKSEIRNQKSKLRGTEHLAAVYEVDQSPIGKTSRSTPGTYIGVFDEIRKLYAQVPVSRIRGYTASRFSFNTEGGRCEACSGQGVIKVEMNFLPTGYVPCADCHGKRYNPATLEVLYHDRSIGDVMEMTLEQAAEFFATHSKIHRSLSLLCDTGLGYLKLGQPSPTLSGGESQRLKLVSELTRGVARNETSRPRQNREPKSTLYLLEEPTIGLHMADVEALLRVLHRLVDDGHTVIVIEHNLSLIADADYLIDIGPEAGDAGGEIVAAGTPEQVAGSKQSRTAPFLRGVLGGQR